MRTKVALAVSAAVMSFSASTMAQLQVQLVKNDLAASQIHKVDSKKQTSQHINRQARSIFTPERNLAPGKYRYFVEFKDAPAALYEGGVPGFKATAVMSAGTGNRKLNVKAPAVQKYRNYLTNRQNAVIQQARSILGQLDVKQQTTLAYNGLVVEMSQADAEKLAMVPGIAYIHREIKRYIQTDSGPKFIKADQIWDGSATGTASKGEGMIVGMIDTGINTDHPSFAAVGGDDYHAVNPLGASNYLGDCKKSEFVSLCNDKLIGVFSYPLITDQYANYDATVPANGEDHNGHGSHTSSTAAGNVLKNVDTGLGVSFDAISGVAPHANIISYQVCLPGEKDAINFSGCYPSLTVLAVENAIENGVDALNYSIGGGSSDPWHDADAMAFLSARKAGIHVATSAGNSGPGPETVGSPGDAPWITTVAAGSHDRHIVHKLNFNAQSFHYEPGTAVPITTTLTGSVTYAGAVDSANIEGCSAFAADSFKDVIALISRGSCAFATKIDNATAAGAKAVIVYNNQGGEDIFSMGGIGGTTIPSLMISQNSGDAFVTALTATPDMTISIDPQASIEHYGGGVLAGFSSRGPNKSVPDVIAPSITAPGLSIFAAYANNQSAKFKENPDPSNFAFLQGTSMASPHIAGALTLLASIHPSWTPAEAQSALMLTANQNTKKEDGVTQADFFDMGSGYANVATAAQTGLVMDESIVDYLKAEPAQGGQPSSINLPTMAHSKCVDICSWKRTVTATSNSSWTASTAPISSGLVLTVAPATFTLTKGQTQELTVTADVTAANAGWNMGNVVLTSPSMPNATMPVAAKANGNNFPDNLSITAHRDTGSLVFKGLKDKSLTTGMQAAVYDKVSQLIAPITLHVPDQGLDYTAVSFSETVPNIVFSISSATAPDVDLRILDSGFNKIGSSAGPTSSESVSFVNLPAGTYYIVVDGYTASAPGATDDVLVNVSSILATPDSLSQDYSVNITEHNTNFDMNFDWTNATAKSGIVELKSADGSYSVQLPWSFARGSDDVQLSAIDLAEGLTPGVAHTFSYQIAPNLTAEDKVYHFNVTLSDAQAAEIKNITGDPSVTIDGGNISWSINQKTGVSADPLTMNFDFIPRKAGSNYQATFTNSLGTDVVTSPAKAFGVVEVAPIASIEAPASIYERQSVRVDGSGSSDANNDSLTYSWVQLSGTPITFDAHAATLSFTEPDVSVDQVMSLQLTVNDGHGNSNTQVVSIDVKNKPSGGSFGWLLLLATPLLWLRRKTAK